RPRPRRGRLRPGPVPCGAGGTGAAGRSAAGRTGTGPRTAHSRALVVPRFIGAWAPLAPMNRGTTNRDHTAPTTRQALWPPKPKLFEMARLTRISRAVFGT